jgi:hypothetical protein
MVLFSELQPDDPGCCSFLVSSYGLGSVAQHQPAPAKLSVATDHWAVMLPAQQAHYRSTASQPSSCLMAKPRPTHPHQCSCPRNGYGASRAPPNCCNKSRLACLIGPPFQHTAAILHPCMHACMSCTLACMHACRARLAQNMQHEMHRQATAIQLSLQASIEHDGALSCNGQIKAALPWATSMGHFHGLLPWGTATAMSHCHCHGPLPWATATKGTG